jgi:hypothetical protein
MPWLGYTKIADHVLTFHDEDKVIRLCEFSCRLPQIQSSHCRTFCLKTTYGATSIYRQIS